MYTFLDMEEEQLFPEIHWGWEEKRWIKKIHSIPQIFLIQGGRMNSLAND